MDRYYDKWLLEPLNDKQPRDRPEPDNWLEDPPDTDYKVTLQIHKPARFCVDCGTMLRDNKCPRCGCN